MKDKVEVRNTRTTKCPDCGGQTGFWSVVINDNEKLCPDCAIERKVISAKYLVCIVNMMTSTQSYPNSNMHCFNFLAQSDI
jgi:hypothetical protein